MVVDAPGRLGHAPADRRRHDVAGREVLLRVHAEHHPLAGAVVEDRPLAAHGFAHQGLLAPASGPVYSTVGWNWTNSTSRTASPARRAIATPSPVTAGGFDVDANTWP